MQYKKTKKMTFLEEGQTVDRHLKRVSCGITGGGVGTKKNSGSECDSVSDLASLR